MPEDVAVGRTVLHLGALWALAFVQPLFGLLGDSAEFFVARGNTAFDIVVFALGYTLVPPLLGAGLVWVAGRIRHGLGWALQLVLIALLAAALVLPPLGDALAGSVASIAVALLAGAGIRGRCTRAPRWCARSSLSSPPRRSSSCSSSSSSRRCRTC